MQTESNSSKKDCADYNNENYSSDNEDDVNPIFDIIDFLVRSAKVSFKNAHVDEKNVKTCEKVQTAYNLYKNSPVDFLIQFGKYLAPSHIAYFEKLTSLHGNAYDECVALLKLYHSEDTRRKRIKNRRFKALQKLQIETDYFSDRQMMSRNPLLYEQLVGQFLTDEEIRERDGIDRENLTFLDIILETVDRNKIREIKNEQMIEEDLDSMSIDDSGSNHMNKTQKKKQWGDFETTDTTPTFKPESRKQAMISAPERRLLREEFLQEMYTSFLEGGDDVDYNSIDNDETLDDLQQISQDAEDKYFDSETNEVESLEEHMALIEEYGKKSSSNKNTDEVDPLDLFMNHISNKISNQSYLRCFISLHQDIIGYGLKSILECCPILYMYVWKTNRDMKCK